MMMDLGLRRFLVPYATRVYKVGGIVENCDMHMSKAL